MEEPPGESRLLVFFIPMPGSYDRMVSTIAGECLVRVAYAPNIKTPIDVSYEMHGRGHREPKSFFEHPVMVARYAGSVIDSDMARGRYFYDQNLVWNRAFAD